MMKSEKKVSEAQKAAQKRYDQEKTKMLSVKYTPVDMEDYEKLKEYLTESGESANWLIKELIHNFLTMKDNKCSCSWGIDRELVK